MKGRAYTLINKAVLESLFGFDTYDIDIASIEDNPDDNETVIMHMDGDFLPVGRVHVLYESPFTVDAPVIKNVVPYRQKSGKTDKTTS